MPAVGSAMGFPTASRHGAAGRDQAGGRRGDAHGGRSTAPLRRSAATQRDLRDPVLRRSDRLRGGRAATSGRIRPQLGLGDRPVMAYVGKFTGRYMDAEMVDFFDTARRRLQPELFFLVLTQADHEPCARRVSAPRNSGRGLSDHAGGAGGARQVPGGGQLRDLLLSAGLLGDRGVAHEGWRISGRRAAGRIRPRRRGRGPGLS